MQKRNFCNGSSLSVLRMELDRARPEELVFKVIASKASNYLVVETSNESRVTGNE